MRESFCNCNHEKCPSCDYRFGVMNERWPPTPPLHRLPALRLVFIASDRRAGLCRFVRLMQEPHLRIHLFPPAPLLPLVPLHHPCPSYNLRRPQPTGLIYLKAICLSREMAQDASAAASPPPWHASFPPRSTPPRLSLATKCSPTCFL